MAVTLQRTFQLIFLEWNSHYWYNRSLIPGSNHVVLTLFIRDTPVSAPLRWRHNDGDSVSNHQPHDCLLNCLFGRTSKKTSNLRVTGLCAGNSPGTGEFPAQIASNAENVSIWWRHHTSMGFYMMTSSNGSISHVTGPLWAEFIGDRWMPLTKASDAELWCFLWSAPEQTVA